MTNRRGFLKAALGAAIAVPDDRDVLPGQHALKIAEGDRDGLYYIPTKYKPGVAMPLWVACGPMGSR